MPLTKTRVYISHAHYRGVALIKATKLGKYYHRYLLSLVLLKNTSCNILFHYLESAIHTELVTQEMKGIRLKIFRSLLEFSCMKWHCWIKWRTWLTVAVVVVYSILLLVFLPLMIFGLYAVHAEIQFSAWFVSAVFVLLTIPIFLANLLQHLYNYTKPQLQAYIVRILWIVPVYSIDSVRSTYIYMYIYTSLYIKCLYLTYTHTSNLLVKFKSSKLIILKLKAVYIHNDLKIMM